MILEKVLSINYFDKFLKQRLELEKIITEWRQSNTF